MDDLIPPPLRVGSFLLRSRLVVGTGKYKDVEQMRLALAASRADAITVAVRRERKAHLFNVLVFSSANHKP